MRNIKIRYLTVVVAAALAGAAGIAAHEASAQKIICWKDKSGKVVGCGDKVPPEYQESATSELDQRGVTRKTTDSADDAAKRKAKEQEFAKQKAEEQKKLVEQRRQDAALLNTFSSEKEIDLKRDRDLQVLDAQLTQLLQTSLKNATDRHNDAKARAAAAEKSKKPVPDALNDEVALAAAEKQKVEQNIAAREKEKEEIRKRYAEMKQRYIELKGGGAQTTAATPAPAKK